MDHIVSHMSQQFHSFICDGCQESFRNRQKLFRHKKKCIRFRALETESENEEIVDLTRGTESLDLSISMSKFFKLRSLDDIIAEELQGIIIFTIRS